MESAPIWWRHSSSHVSNLSTGSCITTKVFEICHPCIWWSQLYSNTYPRLYTMIFWYIDYDCCLLQWCKNVHHHLIESLATHAASVQFYYLLFVFTSDLLQYADVSTPMLSGCDVITVYAMTSWMCDSVMTWRTVHGALMRIKCSNPLVGGASVYTLQVVILWILPQMVVLAQSVLVTDTGSFKHCRQHHSYWISVWIYYVALSIFLTRRAMICISMYLCSFLRKISLSFVVYCFRKCVCTVVVFGL